MVRHLKCTMKGHILTCFSQDGAVFGQLLDVF